MKMENVAVDLGYGYVKAISSNGNKVVFPSVIGDGFKELELANMYTGSNTEEGLHNICVEIKGKRYFVGELAEKESSTKTRVYEKERFNNEYAKILINVAIQLVSESDFVNVFTGLPLDFYSSQSKDFQKSLTGIHHAIDWKSGPINYERKINVENAFIFPQGASALYVALINRQGNFNYPEIMKAGDNIALIDVGFRTTDYVVVEVKENGAFPPISKLSGTVDEGINTLYNGVKQIIKNITGGSEVSESQIEKAINRQYFTYKGEKRELHDSIKGIKENIAASITDEIKTTWTNEFDLFAGAFLAGGGSILLDSFIQPNFDNRLILMNESQLSNVVGYMRLGKIALNSQVQYNQEKIKEAK